MANNWKHKSGEGLWSEYVNEDNNESSVKQHTLKTVKEYCKNKKHYFILESPSSRNVICRKCGLGATFILGLHKLENGKIITIQPQG